MTASHRIAASLTVILASCVAPESEVVSFSERGVAMPGQEVPVPGDPLHYTLELSSGTQTASVVQFGHSLYAYAGQYEFQYPVPNDEGGLVWAVDEAPVDPELRIENTPVIDKEGRRWDWIGWADGGPDTWDDASAEAHDRVDISGDEALDSGMPGHAISSDEEESWGVPYQAQMMTWDKEDCLPGTVIPVSEHVIWDEENRSVSGYTTTPEEGTVLVLRRLDADGDGDLENLPCTGSVLRIPGGDSTHILTAAHCVSSDDTDTGVTNVNNLRVCTFGNEDVPYPGSPRATCRSVDAVFANTDFYSGTHSTNEDFAVLVVDDPELNVSTNFELSGVTSTTWDTKTISRNSHDAYVLGLPASCTSNAVAGEVSMFGGAVGWGLRLHKQAHLDEDFYSTNQIRTTFDSAGGSSGSAYYYCPTNCETSTSAIIGLNTRWDSTLGRMKGPQVGEFKLFVEGTY